MAEERRGTELERILATLAAEGYEIGGEQLKTAPRGYDRDHPRIELLRHKQLFAGRTSASSRSCTPPSCSTWSATTGGRCGRWSSGSRGPESRLSAYQRRWWPAPQLGHRQHGSGATMTAPSFSPVLL